MKKILVVDNDPNHSLLIEEVAEMNGYHVLSVSNPQKAAHELMTHPTIELIIIELMMPEYDGIEVVRDLAQAGFQGTLLFVSQAATKLLTAADNLAHEYELKTLPPLQKPLTLEQIRSSIVKALQPASRQSEASDDLCHEQSGAVQLSQQEIKQAINEKRLALDYQPLLSLKTYQVHALESFVRLVDKNGKHIYPQHFRQLIDNHQLEIDLLPMVVEKFAADYHAYFKEFEAFTYSFNLSAADLENLELPETLEQQFREHKIPTSIISLEINNTHRLRNFRVSLDVLTRLRIKGFKLSVDNFGNGAEQLDHLKKIPLDELKIDPNLIEQINLDPRAYSLVKNIINLCIGLKLETVAKCVEDIETASTLKVLNCDSVQGNYFGKPMPAAELQNFLKDSVVESNQSIADDDLHAIDVKPLSHEDRLANLTISKLIEQQIRQQTNQQRRHNLGLALPLTGNLSAIGKSYYLGVNLALNWLREKHPEIDQYFAISIYDSGSSSKEIIHLYENPDLAHIHYWLGTICPISDIKPLIRYAKEMKEILLAPYIGSHQFRQKHNKNIFNFKSSYYEELLTIMRYISEHRGGRTALVMAPTQMAFEIEEHIAEFFDEVDVIYVRSTAEGSLENTVQKLQAIEAHNVIFICSQKVLLNTYLNYRQYNPEAHFYSVSLISPTAIQGIIPENSKHLYFASSIPSIAQSSLPIITEFKLALLESELSNSKQIANAISVEAFMSMKFTLTLLMRSGATSPRELNDYLAENPIWEIGLNHPVHWNAEQREFGPSCQILKFHNGEWVTP
ncbi:EAL domain-containing protein [Thiomicrorhabdus sp. 6S2-11]|uniref:EAL domain-containing protein n=1 Tax=Thiomicrorhabdus marina TaxID=2818442 RepID=A0ABS3Q5N6_9GAMM|nr:EAL domain-containing protein [Thiomicrorhabdus marina]